MDCWREIEIAVVSLGGVYPACAVLCMSVVALGERGAWRSAAMLVTMTLVAVGIGVATKVAFYAWDVRFGVAFFRGASGHTLRAAAAYPTFAWIAFAGSSHRRCMAWVTVGALVALAVTMAAIDTAIHTPAEGIAGGLIGATVPIVFARMGRLKPISGRMQARLVACAIALCAAMPTTHLDFEQWVVDFSHRLH